MKINHWFNIFMIVGSANYINILIDNELSVVVINIILLAIYFFSKNMEEGE